MKYNSVMYKVNKETRLFIRFLRENGIKYIFIEETLRNGHRRHILNGEANGNLLKYFDKFFSLGFYNVIEISFSWVNSKNGYDFWAKIEREWVKNKYKQMYIND